MIPLPEKSVSVPPVQLTYDKSNKVVEAFNANVMVAVCPAVSVVDVLLLIVPVMVVLVTVFTASVSVFDVNVVDPFVPDMDITPDASEFVFGVNLAV